MAPEIQIDLINEAIDALIELEGSHVNTSTVANVFDFTVVDGSVISDIQKLQDNGHRAKLVYTQTLMHNPFTRDTSYYVLKAIDLEADVKPESTK